MLVITKKSANIGKSQKSVRVGRRGRGLQMPVFHQKRKQPNEIIYADGKRLMCHPKNNESATVKLQGNGIRRTGLVCANTVAAMKLKSAQ